jgi:hypothetical protein
MRSRLPALTMGAVVLLAGWGPQAQAAQTAISDVKVGWTDATHAKITITWTEPDPVANTVSLATVDGPTISQLGTTAAGEKNELVVSTAGFGNTYDPAEQSWIEVSDPAGNEAHSVAFDRFVYHSAATLSFAADGTLHWTIPSNTTVDGTPGDPFDLPNIYRYSSHQTVDASPDPGDCKVVAQSPVTTTPTGAVARLATSSILDISVTNDWGSTGATTYLMTVHSLTTAAPAATQYGASVSLTGTLTVDVPYESGHPPYCTPQPTPGSNATVVLQARSVGGTAWVEAGRTRTDAKGGYTFLSANRGVREYRVVSLASAGGGFATYLGVSATKIVRATTRVMSAKFIKPVISYGATPQAYLWVEPTGTQKAALQFKNASGVWQGLGYKTLYAGKGLLQFPWHRRGTVQFRWWVPGYGGTDATYTGPFSLTVR